MKLELSFHLTICIGIAAVCAILGLLGIMDLWGVLLTVLPTWASSIFAFFTSRQLRIRQEKFEILLTLNYIPQHLTTVSDDLIRSHLFGIRSGDPRFYTSETQTKQSIEKNKHRIYDHHKVTLKRFYKLFHIEEKTALKNIENDLKTAIESMKLSKTERIILEKSQKQ